MTRNTDNQRNAKIKIDELLEKRHSTIVLWRTDDIREIRPDLNEDQAWTVLQECEKAHDREISSTWLLIQVMADALFPIGNDD